ncbi:MAG: hypothetical protein HY899_10565 [Deltaproteobacteria bacterium]|nr:hypothetical protein [Deltaproteobacteria bacterium]
MSRPASACLVALCVLVVSGAAEAGLRETAHNLSPSAFGRRSAGSAVAATSANATDNDLCVYCHTPHSAKTQRGLWSRALEPVRYKLYESSTTEARLQQPNGASRLCLSCHDGTMASGSTSRQGQAAIARLTGRSVLGTDLSDDHPISFVYDQSLVARRRDLANPASLIGGARLDSSGQVQCTSCHDAHAERHPQFLVADPAFSALCLACHRPQHWEESAHAASPASTLGAGSLPGLGYGRVGENGCASCHRSHGAEHPQRLLASATEEGVCLGCHDARVAEKDLRRESRKSSAHRVDVYTDVHDPTENPNQMPMHVECVDCHNAHAARADSDAGPMPGPLTGVSGVSISGGFVREATFEYEICLKCHGISEVRDPVVFRNDSPSNLRMKINPQNASFHPVADVGRNATIAGLISPWTQASRTPCTACHDSDSADRSSPRGPHGSRHRPILAAEYRLDATPGRESYQLYALCYRCHDRNTLLGRRDAFPHRSHVVEDGASCAVCHDAHGSANNAHLINFMRRDVTGKEIVRPSDQTGRLEYLSGAPGSGQCSLSCHGHDHEDAQYPLRLR